MGFIRAVIILYAAVNVKHYIEFCTPPSCTENRICYHPFLLPGSTVHMRVYSNSESCGLRYNEAALYNSQPFQVSSSQTIELSVTVPDCYRERISLDDGLRELGLRIDVLAYGDQLVGSVRVDLTKLDESKELFIPKFKFFHEPVVIRYLGESRDTRGRRDLPIRLMKSDRDDDFFYFSELMIDEISVRESLWVELARPDPEMADKPPVKFKLKWTSISLFRWILINEIKRNMNILSAFFRPAELDEIRYLISDDHIYRFVLSNIISWAHLFLSFMAFKNDVGFFRRKNDLKGISRSTFISSFACSLVIFLYLCDGGGTSSLVLISVGGGVLVDGWKLSKLLKPRLKFVLKFVPMVVFAPSTSGEVESNAHDRVATKYLSLLLFPLVIGSALYNYKFYVYRSYWSWFISNAANAVYTLGFIGMCPQLYINYKLKSVAHLPIRMFVYKIFNTFIDDVFAFLVEMPLKHRLMTLRDDVVFAGFLYQAWIYRVDYTRVNEYGIAFAEEPQGIVDEGTSVNEGDGSGGDDDDDNNDDNSDDDNSDDDNDNTIGLSKKPKI